MPFAVDPRLFEGQDSPVRYDLIFRIENGKPIFVLSASVDALKEIPQNVPLFSVTKEHFPQIGGFVTTEEKLGFGGLFEICEPTLPIDGFTSWKTTVPKRVIVPLDSDKRTNWDSAFRLSATLYVIAFIYQKGSKPNSAGIQQLATFDLVCQPKRHGSELSLTVSPIVRQWITDNLERSKEIAKKAMIATYKHMWPDYFTESRLRLHSFQVESDHNNRQFTLNVPGDACGIYINSAELDYGPGWNFSSHNVDSPIQQLSLLAGICAIIGAVRKSQLK